MNGHPIVKLPVRVLYIFSVILVGLFVVGFLWLVLWAVFVPLQAGVASSMAQYDVANSTYPNYVLADAFMVNLWTYILMLFVFGLLYWVWIYAQRKQASTGGIYQ